ncbi:MAG: glycosyltransferase, partial [Patescibacteria group bacterium]|nr:glycosyltransferase [Patescibacteria group bacterium]
GVLEILKEDETCLTVKPGNADDLAEKILYLRNNPEVLRKISEQGYNLSKERLTSRKLADEFVLACFGK